MKPVHFFILTIITILTLFLFVGMASSNFAFLQNQSQFDSTNNRVLVLENKLDLQLKSTSWEDFLNTHAELVRFYTQNGNIDKAKKLLSKLDEIPVSVYQQKPALAIQATHTKGEFALYEGDINKAVEFFEKAYIDFKKLDRNENLSPQQQLQLNKSMSIALWQSGNLTGARSFAEQSVLIAQNKIGEDSEEVADAYNNFGLILTSQFPENAKEYYQMSQGIYDKIERENKSNQNATNQETNNRISNKLAYTQINLGVILRGQESYVLSENYFKKALSSFRNFSQRACKSICN